jgi:hypothetical protein
MLMRVYMRVCACISVLFNWLEVEISMSCFIMKSTLLARNSPPVPVRLSLVTAALDNC